MSDTQDTPIQDTPILGVRHTRPRQAAPAGACDCHTHVFGPADRFPMAAERVYTPGPASVEALAALNRTLGLQRVVIVQPSPYGNDNRCTLDGITRLNGMGVQARGVAVIDPAVISDAELQAMHDTGIRGVRVNLESVGQQDLGEARAQMQAAARRVAPFGWHVQTYTNLAVIDGLGEVLSDLPTPLVVDHFGRANPALGTTQKGFETLLGLLRGGYAYVKLSAPHRLSDQPEGEATRAMARALIDANPDRAVWGTDWPHPGATPGVARSPDVIETFHPRDDGLALNLLYGWVRSDTELRKILVDNPARLYDFGA